jgi:hypothetical protein
MYIIWCSSVCAKGFPERLPPSRAGRPPHRDGHRAALTKQHSVLVNWFATVTLHTNTFSLSVIWSQNKSDLRNPLMRSKISEDTLVVTKSNICAGLQQHKAHTECSWHEQINRATQKWPRRPGSGSFSQQQWRHPPTRLTGNAEKPMTKT